MFRTLLLSSRSTTSDGQSSPGHLIFISVSAAVLFLLAGTFAATRLAMPMEDLTGLSR